MRPLSCDRKRRSIPAARSGKLGGFRVVERALLGLAPGGKTLRRARGSLGGRRQFGRSGGSLLSEPSRQGLAPRARSGPERKYVELSRRPHHRTRQRGSADANANQRPGGRRRHAAGGLLAARRNGRGSAAP